MTIQEHIDNCKECQKIDFGVIDWHTKLCEEGKKVNNIYRDESLRFQDAFITNPLGPIKIQGELEYDWARGVLYFHSKESGISVLRVCSLPKLDKPPGKDFQIDITHMNGVYISNG